MEIVQQLKVEMVRLRMDNERLMHDQERIMKCFTKRENHRNSKPKPDNGNKAESFRQGEPIVSERIHTQRSEGDKDENEE